MSDKDERIIICGTGRCGTTFLMILFTLLGLDTGYTRENYHHHLSQNCNSGMENRKLVHRYTKNPAFTDNIPHLISTNRSLVIKFAILPIRRMDTAAQSRINIGRGNGGLWNAKDFESQKTYYQKILTTYLENMVQHDIPTIFLDFERMTTDVAYLYERIHPTFPRDVSISIDTFRGAFEEACQVGKLQKRVDPSASTLVHVPVRMNE